MQAGSTPSPAFLVNQNRADTLTVSSTKTIPTVTTTPALTEASTLSLPQATNTVTNSAQLSDIEREQALRNLLKTNGGCSQPCFFGIVPGKTSLAEAENLLTPMLGEGLKRTNSDGTVSSFGIGFGLENTLRGEIILTIKSDVVQNINVYMGGLFKPDVPQEDWSSFSLKSILETYGVPTGVTFYMESPHEPVSNPGMIYSYMIMYEHKNVGVFFQGGWIKNSSIYHLCLSQLKPEFIRIWIGENPYLASTDGIQPAGSTSIDLQEFYQLFSENDDGCIDLQGKAFK
jgi:hypothetical protein